MPAHGEIDGNKETMDGMWTIVGNINRWEELCEAERGTLQRCGEVGQSATVEQRRLSDVCRRHTG